MSIYAISDLHLALSIDKPMDVFGGRWSNYMDRLKENWERLVKDGDYVIIPGDISWATYFKQAIADFQFIHGLPGIKLISKGNHDYWWSTMHKLEQFIEQNHFTSIRFLHNNSIIVEDIVLCGTRGWKCPGDNDFNAEDEKIYQRELQRLELSLKSAASKAGQDTTMEGEAVEKKLVVALHFPPFNIKKEETAFIELMVQYGVKACIYGHVHGAGHKNCFIGEAHGISFQLVAADYLGFEPFCLRI